VRLSSRTVYHLHEEHQYVTVGDMMQQPATMYSEGGVLISSPPQRADSLLCPESCDHCAGSEIDRL